MNKIDHYLKGKKVIALATEFTALKPKAYSYLTDATDENKKAKDTKKYFIKRKLKFVDYKHRSDANQLEKNKPARKKVLHKIIKNL